MSPPLECRDFDLNIVANWHCWHCAFGPLEGSYVLASIACSLQLELKVEFWKDKLKAAAILLTDVCGFTWSRDQYGCGSDEQVV